MMSRLATNKSFEKVSFHICDSRKGDMEAFNRLFCYDLKPAKEEVKFMENMNFLLHLLDFY